MFAIDFSREDKYKTYSKVVWGVIIFLGIISSLGVYSSVGSLAYRCMKNNTEYYLIKHVLIVLVSFFSIYMIQNMDYKYFGKLAKIGMVISIPMLIITWRYGVKLNEASRWLSIPLWKKSFQPSDLAQVSLIVYLASFYAKNQDKISNIELVLIPSMRWIISICGLIALANVSGAIHLLAVSIMIMFVCRVPLKYIFVIGLLAFFICSFFVLFGQRSGTAKKRVRSFFSGEKSFQSKHAQIAIVSGGITGKGVGKSDQRDILPHPYSDFIYAILVEEYGFLGGLLVLILYLILLYGAFKIFNYSKNIYKSFISISIAISIVMQAFLNISVSVGIFPVTGMTLPFVSMGGTSLIFSGVSLGVMLSCMKPDKLKF